jgi:hypothetical protein
MTEHIEPVNWDAFGRAGYEFGEKYAETLGPTLTATGALIAGITAMLMVCDCGGMRRYRRDNSSREILWCPRCDGWWAMKSEVEGNKYKVSANPVQAVLFDD